MLLKQVGLVLAFMALPVKSAFGGGGGYIPFLEVIMDRRLFVAALAAVLTGGASRGLAADPAKGNFIKVVVEGSLGTIVLQEKTDSVTATDVAAGGEFVIDASASKTAREDLVRLAEKYIKGGSTLLITPQLKVTGRLEFRATKVVGEKGAVTDGPKACVLVADSVVAIESRLK